MNTNIDTKNRERSSLEQFIPKYLTVFISSISVAYLYLLGVAYLQGIDSGKSRYTSDMHYDQDGIMIGGFLFLRDLWNAPNFSEGLLIILYPFLMLAIFFGSRTWIKRNHQNYMDKHNKNIEIRRGEIPEIFFFPFSNVLISLLMFASLLSILLVFFGLPNMAHRIGEESGKRTFSNFTPCNEKSDNPKRLCMCIYNDKNLWAHGMRINRKDDQYTLFTGNEVAVISSKGKEITYYTEKSCPKKLSIFSDLASDTLAH